MNPEKIGKFICELRKEKELSQYQLADMIPISRQAVSKWERGVTTPDTQVLIQLSELFNVTIDELLRGEKIENPSIKDLEETTLNILDDSNKKTKKIKRISIISISIIVTLLLAFLSYYFINSYNTMEVYKIGNTNDKFATTDGILITTSEKYYIKLGTIKNKINADIKNIKLYYKNGNKKITIAEDKDVNNIVLMESYGYKSKFSKKNIINLKDNLYLEITYNENKKETIKLKYYKNYNNNNLFFLQQQKNVTNDTTKNTEKESIKEEDNTKQEEQKEETKEEVKPTINESTNTNTTKPEQPQQSETPQAQELTISEITNKIKETCIPDIDSYICEYQNYLILYLEADNQITILKNDDLFVDYIIKDNNYICSLGNCKDEFNKVIKDALFK